MTVLIEQLEQAEEGDSKLDIAIAKEIGGQPTGYWAHDTGDWHDIWHPPELNGLYRPLPHFTRSVDAALTLVPVGREIGSYSWRIATPGRDNGKLVNQFVCRIDSPYSSGGGPYWQAFAPTLPLAICIAALRAKGDDHG